MKAILISLVLIGAGLPSKGSAQDYGLPVVVGSHTGGGGCAASGLGADGISYSLSGNNAECSDATLNVGADVNTVVGLAYSADLSRGDTEAQADKWRHFAIEYPYIYTWVSLDYRVQETLSRMFNQSTSFTTIQVNLVMRTQDNKQPLQAHLIESFTCNAEVLDICEHGKLNKLPDYTSTPWFKEQIQANLPPSDDIP